MPGILTARQKHDMDRLTRDALLKQNLAGPDSVHIFFEPGIPRMGKRVDIAFMHTSIVLF